MIYQLTNDIRAETLSFGPKVCVIPYVWNGFDPSKVQRRATALLCPDTTYGHFKWRDKRQRCSGHTVLDSQKNWNWAAVDNMRLTISPHHFHSNHWYHRVRISSFVHSITRSRSSTTQVCFFASRCGGEITRLPALANTIFIHLKSASGNDSTRYQEVYCS